MGRTLCPTHGPSAIAFVCPHVAEAVAARRTVETRRVDVDWNLDLGTAEPVVVEHDLCHGCWNAVERRFRDRELDERELDELGKDVTCYRCFSEASVPSGLPALRLLLRD